MNTGGPAFPSSNDVVIGNVGTSGHTGMTLRDYFAAKVMQAMYSRFGGGAVVGDDGHGFFNHAASGAYAMADAMLAAREAK